MSRRRLTAQVWRELLARQRSSGLTVAAFCRQEDVAMSTFFAWRRRLALRDEPPFVEVACVGQSPKPAEDAASSSMLGSESMSAAGSDAMSPAMSAPCSGGIELLLPGGVRVCVREGFDAAMLRRVVEALS